MDLSLFDVFEKPKSENKSHLSSDLKHNDRSSNKRQFSEKQSNQVENTTATGHPNKLVKFSALPEDVITPAVSEQNKLKRPPAKQYPFQLDQFQQEAVDYIERGESVLVAAHTSAGKTAVAEYAIAASLRDGQKVIYTSPIKALSNQKYRDLQDEFKDVGLMTGDMTINPSASCLIMTTEILRSMLYRGSEVVREVAWVIYDEVHYMRDKERGVVWEESIIMLPHKIRFVFLSATIPNSKEFVSWISKLHHQPCHVVYTDYRPVPLQHFVFPAGGDGLYLVVDEKGSFREDNFQRAMSSLVPEFDADEKNSSKKRKKNSANVASDLYKVVRLVMDRQLDPCIVFSFSKKDCEQYAVQMARLDFNNEDEKALVEQVFLNAIDALSEDDRMLPQIATILPLLKRGVGIHHGGLLPILKEVIEILFQEGLIKCLFATETFSIGINMPAKTVVFTKTRKFDGEDFRWITSGEYIQMSGRAGRRGKDDKGIVIQMLDEKMAPDVAKGMIYGASDPLHSSYHVGYNMLLNMLRVEDSDPENILRSSFYQYQREQEVPKLEEQAASLEQEAATLQIEDKEVIAEFFTLQQLKEKTNEEISRTMTKPNHCLPYLNSGRLVSIRCDNKNWGWAALISYCKGEKRTGICVGFDKVDVSAPNFYSVEVLMKVEVEVLDDGTEAIHPFSGDGEGRSEVIIVPLSAIQSISAIRMNLPKDLSKSSSRSSVMRAFTEIFNRFGKNPSSDSGNGIPCLHPVNDMAINTVEMKSLLDRQSELDNRIKGSPVNQIADKEERLTTYSKQLALLDEARKLRQQAKLTQVITMKDELRRMKRVLRRLEYISPDGVLSVKGRFSCELSAGDELVITDITFDGIFNDLTVEQSVALLSCFVHKEGQNEGGIKIQDNMTSPYQKLVSTARKIARVCIESNIDLEEEAFVKSFNPALIEVTYMWASGARFADICRVTEIFEGSIIRSLKRLEELLRQLASGALAIGNNELKTLFENGANKIRRGIVFAASLYL